MKTLKCDLCEVTAEGETFEEWMVVNFKLNKYYDIESEVYSEEETQKNITRLNNVIFEECVERLRLELNL